MKGDGPEECKMFVEARREAGGEPLATARKSEVLYPGSICPVMRSRESAERIVVNRSEVVLGDRRIFEDSGDGRREVERQVETRQTMHCFRHVPFFWHFYLTHSGKLPIFWHAEEFQR